MNDYGFDSRYISVGVLVMVGLVTMIPALYWLRLDDVTTVDASGLRIRRGWRRRSLSWDQVRGHLEARAIPPNGKGGLSRGGTWNWGWRAQVHYRDGERDVPLAGASLMAWDKASALQLASERIDLLRSYDPDPTATAWSQPAAPPAQYGVLAPQSYPPAPTSPSDDSWREPGLYGRPASAWEIMTSPAGKAIDKKEGLQ